MKSIILAIVLASLISVLLSVGIIFFSKDDFIGQQGIQGIQGERGAAGITTIKTITINPLSGKWVEHCIDGGFMMPMAHWCVNKVYLWEK